VYNCITTVLSVQYFDVDKTAGWCIMVQSIVLSVRYFGVEKGTTVYTPVFSVPYFEVDKEAGRYATVYTTVYHC